jgi:hypothetical protein
MSGSLLSDRLLTPRTRSCAPVPTCPVPGSAISPGVRCPTNSTTLRAGATASTSAAFTVSMTLPTARRCVTPPVPVTTTWSSCVERVPRARFTTADSPVAQREPALAEPVAEQARAQDERAGRHAGERVAPVGAGADAAGRGRRGTLEHDVHLGVRQWRLGDRVDHLSGDRARACDRGGRDGRRSLSAGGAGPEACEACDACRECEPVPA